MGNYVKNNLISGETIEYETTYHWIIFITKEAIFFVAPITDSLSDEFVITNKRVIMKTGLIKRRTIELNLTMIESVNVDQSVLGRILGFGNIQIVGSGGTKETFSNIKKPLEFRKKFQELC